MSGRRPAARVPGVLPAAAPAEERGRGRDDVRLMVSRGAAVSHHAFRELPGQLRAGDVLVVNTSRTLPAAVDGTAAAGGRVVVHFSARGDDGRWAVELREPVPGGSTRRCAGGPAGSVVRLPGGVTLVWDEPPAAGEDRLWWVRPSAGGGPELLGRHGRPIRYAYIRRDQPLSAHQTVLALDAPDGAGSAEMPSAARPFTAGPVAELVSRGIQFAPVVLHTGVASAEADETPYPERFEVSAATARLVNAAKAGVGRIVAVGTTAVRALETAAGSCEVVRALSGWPDLLVTPGRGVRVVEGLLTGLHEPGASHLLMLEAVAGPGALERSYAEAVRALYLRHEFGDVHLILPHEEPDTPHCSSNAL
ncbi:S-adenosylmethionine:tRNA ribosyltransferase-isomerase [Streptomyces sp. NBC_00388]|uniref:S-adenosylmethionine:tRNA ribosyltransferase-isomerase n=1 Tax=Streptomyces sp. NBC_00388 TaxID=2975735 RepID=UPI002E22DFDE